MYWGTFKLAWSNSFGIFFFLQGSHIAQLLKQLKQLPSLQEALGSVPSTTSTGHDNIHL